MRAMPTIQKYMTTSPYTIGGDQTLAKAEKFMREHKIRHLPVLEGGRLVGILSDRDVKLVESFLDGDPEKVRVDDAYTPDPYITHPEAPVDEVCDRMVERKFGCVLVQDGKKLVGIFTWIDALTALSEILNQRTHTRNNS